MEKGKPATASVAAAEQWMMKRGVLLLLSVVCVSAPGLSAQPRAPNTGAAGMNRHVSKQDARHTHTHTHARETSTECTGYVGAHGRGALIRRPRA